MNLEEIDKSIEELDKKIDALYFKAKKKRDPEQVENAIAATCMILTLIGFIGCTIATGFGQYLILIPSVMLLFSELIIGVIASIHYSDKKEKQIPVKKEEPTYVKDFWRQLKDVLKNKPNHDFYLSGHDIQAKIYQQGEDRKNGYYGWWYNHREFYTCSEKLADLIVEIKKENQSNKDFQHYFERIVLTNPNNGDS